MGLRVVVDQELKFFEGLAGTGAKLRIAITGPARFVIGENSAEVEIDYREDPPVGPAPQHVEVMVDRAPEATPAE